MIFPDQTDFLNDLSAALDQNGMSEFARDAALMEKFYRLTCRMLEVNEHMNLTAIKEPRAVVLRHYADSLTIAHLLPQNARVADIGCGAGFPTLPLAIFRPDIKITALDGTAKRIEYVKNTAKAYFLP